MSFESVSESHALELLLLSDVTLSPGEVELGGETGICLSQIGLDFESWIFNKIGLVSSALIVVNMLWSLLLARPALLLSVEAGRQLPFTLS